MGTRQYRKVQKENGNTKLYILPPEIKKKMFAQTDKKNYIMANKKATICALKALIQNVKLKFLIDIYKL